MASPSFFPSSSSSLVTKKPTKASQLRATLFRKASSLKNTSLAKRRETVFRKAMELSILCGVQVCVIYYGSDGALRTWPKDREKVKDMALRYSQLSDVKRGTKQYGLEKFLEEIDDPKKKKAKLESSYKYPDWDPRFDNFSEEQLTEVMQSLERKQTVMQHRLRAVLESHERHRSMRYMNVANQEQMQMNRLQLQQQLTNEAQSLAPLPDSLTVYQYPNMVDMYSRLLGGQDTGTSEFLSTSMIPYNSFDTNCVSMFPNQFNQNCSKVEDYSVFPRGTGINSMNVEDYTGTVWAQGSGINGLQNMDMYGYNNNNNSNTNGFSNQLVQ